MFKSFRLYVVICVMCVAALVVYLNRRIAQYLLPTYLEQQIDIDMRRNLFDCRGSMDKLSDFGVCLDPTTKGQILKPLTDFYILCPAEQSAQQPDFELCQRILHNWTSRPQSLLTQTHAQSALVVDGSQTWHAARLLPPHAPDMVALPQSHIDAFVQDIWGLRDRNLIYTLPFIFLSLFGFSYFVYRLTMQPFWKINAALKQLTSVNLHVPADIKGGYREFEGFVKVFVDLQDRLNKSFVKARRFAGDASHELRTPLTILRGQAEQLISELPLASDEQLRAMLISDEIERLIDIIEKLLLLSRADANSIFQDAEEFNLSEYLILLMNDSEQAQSQIALLSDIQPDVYWHADRALVIQLIQNLYSNATKYNQPHGWIRIGLAATDRTLTLSMENPSQHITPELVERVFDRFYRGNMAMTKHVTGQGLGLSLCLEIAQLHQGQLTVTAREGDIFCVQLTAPLRVQLGPLANIGSLTNMAECRAW